METYLANFVGKVVLFKIETTFLESCRALIQPNPNVNMLYAQVIAIDGIGCWIKHHSWKSTDAMTSANNKFEAHLLLPWQAIQSCAAFPHREFSVEQAESVNSSFGFLGET